MAGSWPFTNYRSSVCLCLSRTWTTTKMAAPPMHQTSHSRWQDPWRRLQLDKLNPSHWFNFGLKGLIGIGGLMLLGLLSVIWLKRLITWETNCCKTEKFLNTFFIKNKKGEDMGNFEDSQSLLKRSSHCSFCATALREITTVQKDTCWTTLFSLCMGPGRPSPKSSMFGTWARNHSNMTANPSTEVQGNLETGTYSFLLVCTA
jgi:hypothetical protein